MQVIERVSFVRARPQVRAGVTRQGMRLPRYVVLAMIKGPPHPSRQQSSCWTCETVALGALESSGQGDRQARVCTCELSCELDKNSIARGVMAISIGSRERSENTKLLWHWVQPSSA
jgi:hypothetical protein